MNFERDKNMKEIDDKEQLIIDSLGETGALNSITRALGYDQKKDVYDYIIRCYDLEENPEKNETKQPQPKFDTKTYGEPKSSPQPVKTQRSKDVELDR